MSNFDKTDFFAAIAEMVDAEATWIVPSARWSSKLQRRGFSRLDRLELARHASRWKRESVGSSTEVDEGLGFLGEHGSLPVAAIIAGDRLLSRQPQRYAHRYLAVTASLVEEFLRATRPDVVIGEATWALEMVTAAVARSLDIPYLVPASVRIPGNRFGFFQDVMQQDLLELRRSSPVEDEAWALEQYEEFRVGKQRPEYFYRYLRAPVPRTDWVIKTARRVRDNVIERGRDESLKSIGQLSGKMSPLRSTRHMLELRRHPPFMKGLPAGPFVVFPLHRQPESSVDVLAYRWRDQAATALAIAAHLPPGVQLAVREHPNGVGDRGLQFYEQLRDQGNIALLDPYEDSYAVLERCLGVVVLTGTMGYEAALLGKPTLTMVPMFFGRLPGVTEARQASDVAFWCEGILAGGTNLPDAAERGSVEFLAWLRRHSAVGHIGDPFTAPEVMDPGNLERVANTFNELAAALKGRGTRP